MAKVVFLLSEKSSGSSSFLKELDAHPDVSVIEHTEHFEKETLFWLKAACLLGAPSSDFLDGTPKFTPDVARAKLQRLILENVPGFDIAVPDLNLVFGGFDALVARHAPVFFEKSPHHLQNWAALALMLQWADETKHDVSFLGLARNPMAMLYSAWSRWREDPEQRQWQWKQTYDNLDRFHGRVGRRMLVLRYEDLVAAPEEFQTVLDWIGIPRDARVGRGVHTGSIEKWSQDRGFAFRLAPAVARTAHRIGYPADQVSTRSNRRVLWTLQRWILRRRELISARPTR